MKSILRIYQQFQRLRTIVLPLLAGIATAFSACHDDTGVPQGDILVRLDSVQLEENDTAFVGQPTAFTATSSGGYLIADQRNGTVHEYDAAGRHIRDIGRRGNGPNEFSAGPGEIVLDGDSLLFVVDANLLKLFDFRSGTFRWQRRLPAFSGPQVANKGVLYLNHLDRNRHTSIITLQSESDSAVSGGPFPAPHGQNAMIDDYFAYSKIAPRHNGDTVAVVFQSSDNLYVGSLASGKFDSIPLPIVRRRGARLDLIAAATDNPASLEPLLYKQSIPWAFDWLPSGALGVVHVDVDWVSNSRFEGVLYFSVIDPRSNHTCTDLPISAPVDPRPYAGFRADTLLVLIQDVVIDSTGVDQAITFVDRYVIDEEVCGRE